MSENEGAFALALALRSPVPSAAISLCHAEQYTAPAMGFVQASPTSLQLNVTGGYSSSGILFLFIPEGTRALRPLEGGRVIAGLGVVALP